MGVGNKFAYGNVSDGLIKKVVAQFFPASQYVIVGVGSPVGVIDAPLGTLYLNTSGGVGTTLFVKEAVTNMGWAAK